MTCPFFRKKFYFLWFITKIGLLVKIKMTNIKISRFFSKKAFTLIELLVVIVIIGILSTIAVSTFSNYFVKARDAKRIAQFKQTVDIIKQYVITNEKLPNLTGSMSPSRCGGWRVINKNFKEKIIELENDYQLKLEEDYWGDCIGFNFYIYPPGAYEYNCPKDKGKLLVFGTNIEQIYKGQETRESLGLSEYNFSCQNRNWTGEGEYRNLVFGIFENGDFGPQ